MTEREQLSVWMPPGTKARIKALAREREPISSVLSRGLDALEGQPAPGNEPDLRLRLEALEALEARVEILERNQA